MVSAGWERMVCGDGKKRRLKKQWVRLGALEMGGKLLYGRLRRRVVWRRFVNTEGK